MFKCFHSKWQTHEHILYIWCLVYIYTHTKSHSYQKVSEWNYLKSLTGSRCDPVQFCKTWSSCTESSVKSGLMEEKWVDDETLLMVGVMEGWTDWLMSFILRSAGSTLRCSTIQEFGNSTHVILVRGWEHRSNYPPNHPKPKTLSRFCANEKPALFSSAHQTASQDPSVM